MADRPGTRPPRPAPAVGSPPTVRTTPAAGPNTAAGPNAAARSAPAAGSPVPDRASRPARSATATPRPPSGGDAHDAHPGHDAHAGHDAHFRHSYSKDRAVLLRRLSRIEGQVRGIARMIEREDYCMDILQQTAALRAAVDALSVLVLEDHVQGCIRTAAERGEADIYVDEVLDVVRRTLGRPIRSGTTRG